MKTVIIYESMYGNTHAIANAIGQGLAPACDVTVVPVAKASQALLREADLVVVGGPTHAHGMSRPGTRKSAAEAAHNPSSRLDLDPDAAGPGVRDWLATLGQVNIAAAAFDTRLAGPAAFTGRASRGIARLLRQHAFAMVAEPESFLVTKESELRPGETARAREWGAWLGEKAAAGTASSAGPR